MNKLQKTIRKEEKKMNEALHKAIKTFNKSKKTLNKKTRKTLNKNKKLVGKKITPIYNKITGKAVEKRNTKLLILLIILAIFAVPAILAGIIMLGALLDILFDRKAIYTEPVNNFGMDGEVETTKEKEEKKQ